MGAPSGLLPVVSLFLSLYESESCPDVMSVMIPVRVSIYHLVQEQLTPLNRAISFWKRDLSNLAPPAVRRLNADAILSLESPLIYFAWNACTGRAV